MQTFLSRNYFGFLLLLIFIILADSWVLQSTFENVVTQQNRVKIAYDAVDRISDLTVELRDAELSTRRFLLTGTIDQFDLSKQFDSVVQDATLASTEFAENSAEKEIMKQFSATLSAQLSSVLNVTDRSKSNTAAGREVVKSDENYIKLASMLSKIKQLEESKLKSKTDPVGRYKDVFYLASIITALLNLLVGLLAYRQLASNRKRFEVDRSISLEKAEESRVAAQASRW